jgi:imidazoleglycerol phosphate synthase glutamine amidotransferase subunit HisH
MELLDLPNKEYCFICYSMEYVLHKLGYPVLKRNANKKEDFLLSLPTPYRKTPASLYRNHRYYIPAESIDHLAEYDGEAMIVQYKQAYMTQFHPEKSEDGKQMLFVWLHQTASPLK